MQLAEVISAAESRRSTRQIRQWLHSFGLGPTGLLALRQLHSNGPQTMGSLAKLLDCGPSSATSIVDSIERSGYAERVYDKADRRVVNVQITDKGRNLLESK